MTTPASADRATSDWSFAEIDANLMRAQEGFAAEVEAACTSRLAAPGLDPDGDQAQWIRFVLFVALVQDGPDLDRALIVADDLLAVGERTDAPAWQCLGQAILANIATYSVSNGAAYDQLLHTVAMTEDLLAEVPDLDRLTYSSVRALGFAVNAVVIGLSELGLYDECLEWLETMGDIAHRSGTNELRLSTAVNVGETHWHLACRADILGIFGIGDSPDVAMHATAARTAFQRAAEIHDAAGYSGKFGACSRLMATAAGCFLDEGPATLHALEEQLDSLSGPGALELVTYANLALAIMHNRDGRPDDARQALPRADVTAEGLLNPSRMRMHLEAVLLDPAPRRSEEPAPAWTMLEALVRNWYGRHVADIEAYAERVDRVRQGRINRRRAADYMTDPLTGIGNRRLVDAYLDDHLAARTADSRPLSVVFADLDDFKQVNDRHSHLVGDQVLRRFAELMRSSLGRDAVVARFGGDEFVVVFDGLTDMQAKERLERLRTQLKEQPLLDADVLVRITAGVAQAWPGATPHEILTEADRAMLTAKQSGKDQIAIAER